MNKLIFLCQWGNNRKTAWSGTCLRLYKALEEFYEVEDIPIKSNLWSRVRGYLYKKISFVKYDFFYRDIRSFNKSPLASTLKDKVCSLQFSEIDLPSNVHCYVYQDMCIKYIDDVIMKDDVLRKFFKKNVSQQIIKIRLKKQADFYSTCKGIFVMGEWLKKYMVDEMGIDSSIVHCVGAGYDVDYSKCDFSRRESNKILFVGRDFERKGGNLLLEAFKILKKRYQADAELYIVGPFMNGRMNAEEGIYFVEDISSEDIVRYYEMCDVFCMPSYLEPFGKVYVEALACSMPVIARNSFAASDFIIDGINGALIENDDAEKMAEIIFGLLHDDKVKKYVYENSKEIQQKYSWKAVAKRMADIIDMDEYMRK